MRIHNTGVKQYYRSIDIRGERIIGIALIHFFQYRALTNINEQTPEAGTMKIPESDMYLCQ
jgi:hypothetical protein